MERLILVGLVEPIGASAIPAFEQVYLGNHVGDTSHCPRIRRGTLYKLAKKFVGSEPSPYLASYEWEIDVPAEAEKLLTRWQSDPTAFPARLPPNGSLKNLGSG